jgi:ATP/maltotriose-dependent transcriptional regulator MalT
VVGTFRSDELPRGHPLRSLLTTWERSRSVHRIELFRFAREEVDSQLRAILGGAPDTTLLDTVFERSDGNAFLVEELLGVVMAGGDPTGLPASLRDVLLARLDGLGPQAQRLLRTAAVGGRWVPEPLLLAVSGLDEAVAFSALREAVDNHLLVVDDAGRGYTFRHTLARDAVYEDMLPGERGRLHHRYGEVLSEQPEIAGDDRGAVAADLAHHWYAALDLPRALGSSVAAAAQASQRFAPAEALQHLERVLQIWPRVADATSAAGMDQVEVLRLAAQAAFAAGEVDRSLALLDQAITELGDGDDPSRRAILLERKAQAFGALGMSRSGLASLTDALSGLPPEETTTAHAVVLSAMANALMRVNDAPAAASMAQRAVTAARISGAEQNEADASITLGVVTAQLGDPEAGLAAGRAGIERALAAGHASTALRGYVNLSDSLEQFGRSTEAVELATEGTALAERAGYTRSIGAFLTGNRVESLVHLGRWAEAEQLITTTLAAEPEGVFAASVLEVRAQMAALAGRYDEARTALERTRALMGEKSEPQFDSPLAFTSAELARVEGDLTGALKTLQPVMRDSPSDPWTWRHNWPLAWQGTRIQADLAIASRDRRTPVEPLDPVFEQAVARLKVTTPPAEGFQAMCAGERARYSSNHDPGLWEAAAAIWRGLERAYELTYCLLRVAEAEAVAGQRETAERAVVEAHTLATRIGATPLVHHAERLARQARLSLAPTPLRQSPEPDATNNQLDRYGLTPREVDVLLMLAEGRSNPQIGKALFISPKTASVHVSNILGKLGVSGRVEAAGLVHRLGLADGHADD